MSILWDRKNLTFDHVLPKSLGGQTTWENVATACSPCNVKKGGKMPKDCGMIPKVKPYKPTEEQLQKRKKFPTEFLASKLVRLFVLGC